MRRYFLAAKDVGDLTRIFCAALEEQNKKGAAQPGQPRSRFPQAALGRRGFLRRQRPLARARGSVHGRSRGPDPPVPDRRCQGRRRASRNPAHGHALARFDRRHRAQRSCRQPDVPRHRQLAPRSGACASAHERSRRARPLHAGVRPRRRADAVQHVPPLHGGRAPAVRRRQHGLDRARRIQERTPAFDRVDQARALARGALSGDALARHRQGLARRSLQGRRCHRRSRGGAAGLGARRRRRRGGWSSTI